MHWVAHNRDWFSSYIGTIADQMGLRDWKIILLDDAPSDDDAGAQNELVYGRKVAKLQFAAPESPEELRHWVVHELLHCHAALLSWNANAIQLALSPQTFDVWHGSFEDAAELMIDGVAAAWAEMLPLPPEKIRTPEDAA